MLQQSIEGSKFNPELVYFALNKELLNFSEMVPRQLNPENADLMVNILALFL